MSVKDPRTGLHFFIFELHDHQRREAAAETLIVNKRSHCLKVDGAGFNREARMAMPLTNVIEPGITMIGPIKKPGRLASHLHQVDDKAGKCSGSCLDRNLCYEEIRRR